MSKYAYATERFTDAGLAVIEQADQFCSDYARQGYRLTLRQLYYRFIATGTLPDSRIDKQLGTKNTERNYKWLGDLVSRGRVAGMIDWSHIEDRTRSVGGGDGGWESPAEAAESIVSWYSISKWDGQPEYCEVWVEKEALASVVAAPAGRWNVTHLACKGSPSTSLMRSSALRLRQQERDGRKAHVIYLGDHDPTGLDIDRDIEDRLRLFGSSAAVTRIALTMDQIERLNPPPSPVKTTDSRTQGYIDRYGTEDCWELDAIEPADLDSMIEQAILEHLDMDGWNARVEQEEDEKRVLAAMAENWPEVEQMLRDQGYVD